MKGKLFLAGGGNKKQSIEIDKLFSQDVGKILYIPIAIDTTTHPYDSCLKYIQSCLTDVAITMETDLKKLDKMDLEEFDGIYIGGGDTVKLHKGLKSISFYNKLREFNKNGGHIYGGSAGAIILGKSIISAEKGNAKLPDDIVGAKLIDAIIWPHYEESDDQDIIDMKTRVFAIPEDGAIISGEEIELIGDADIFEENPYLSSESNYFEISDEDKPIY